MNDKKMMQQLFKQFGITQFDFVKGHDRDGYYTGKTGNEYFEVKMMMQCYIFNSNRKIKT
jgi:O-phosphoseryl-tRNA(Cys) synthetase